IALRSAEALRHLEARRWHAFIGQYDVGEFVFVRVANDGADAGECGDFFRSTLGVASGDDDFCRWILAADAADGSSGILIGGSGDGASVEQDEVGVRGGSAGQAASLELAFQGGAVGLGGAASEIYDVKGSHAIMVAQAAELCGHTSIPARRCQRVCRHRGEDDASQAVATFLFWVKHSRQRIGRPWVGRKGTVVSLPHWEQVARVSTRVKCGALPFVCGAVRMAVRLALQVLQRLGSFLNCLSWKKSCSPAVKTKSAPQSIHFRTLSWNSMESCSLQPATPEPWTGSNCNWPEEPD